MKKILIVIIYLTFFLYFKQNCYAQTGNLYGVWQTFGDLNYFPTNGNNYTDYNGRLLNINWSELQTDPGNSNYYNWSVFDQQIKTRTSQGTYPIILLIYVYNLPATVPSFILSDPNVSKVTVSFSQSGESYDLPYFADPEYKLYFKNMITAVKNHIQTVLTTNYNQNIKNAFKKIIGIQACYGSTGDYISYKGDVIDFHGLPTLTCNDFTNLFKEFSKYYFQEYTALNQQLQINNLPPVRVMFNPGNQKNENDAWLSGTGTNDCNCGASWRKAGLLGHGYQLNLETQNLNAPVNLCTYSCDEGSETADWWYQSLNKYHSSMQDFTRARCELSGELISNRESWWYDGNVSNSNHIQNAEYRNMFALFAYMSYWGVDMVNLPATILNDRLYDYAISWFNNISRPEQKSPATATRAFCVLRDGIDAADYNRFPANPGDQNNPIIDCFETAPKSQIKKRFSYVLNSDPGFKLRGADIRDINSATGGTNANLTASRINDVGWKIFPNNYSRYITQINPKYDFNNDGILEVAPLYKTCDGWWNISALRYGEGDPSTYGRFAKSISNVYGKRAMYFDIDNNFLAGFNGQIAIAFTFLDKGCQSFFVKWKNGSQLFSEQIFKSCNNHGGWRTWTLNAGLASSFQNACDNQSDFYIETFRKDGTEPEEHIFAMVEILKSSSGLKYNTQQNFNNNNLSISPNPTSNEFTIETKDKKIIQQLLIYNQLGNLVLNRKIYNYSYNIKKQELGYLKGVYFVQAIIADGKVEKSTVKIL